MSLQRFFLITNQHPTLQPYHTTPLYLLNLASTTTLPSFLLSFLLYIYIYIYIYTVGKKSIRALEIFRVQKLILNATS